jgi:hypothetical protein
MPHNTVGLFPICIGVCLFVGAICREAVKITVGHEPNFMADVECVGFTLSLS